MLQIVDFFPNSRVVLEVANFLAHIAHFDACLELFKKGTDSVSVLKKKVSKKDNITGELIRTTWIRLD